MLGEILDDATQWQVGPQVRRTQPVLVVIWSARDRQFRALDRFRAPPGTPTTGMTTDEFVAEMDASQQAAPRSPSWALP